MCVQQPVLCDRSEKMMREGKDVCECVSVCGVGGGGGLCLCYWQHWEPEHDSQWFVRQRL